MRNSKIGTYRSEETKSKISNYRKGKKLPQETKNKMRESTTGDKNPMWGKLGKDNPRSIPVKRYDLEGNFIDEWENCKQAASVLGLSYSAINACMNGRQKTSGGFIWIKVNEL